MRKLLVLLALLAALPSLASAREGWRGWCEQGNNSVVTSGISSTTKVQRSFPQCQVLVLVHGGGVATIYADNNGTPLANPFQANLDGSWIAYASDGRYDFQVTQGSGLSFTYLDVLLCDPFVPGAVCAAGGAASAHNLLSTTHLDTIPFSPPVRGDLITAQNMTSPTGVNPAWARLPLGTSGYVLLSNGTDALWGPLTAGSGITITNNSGSLTIASSGGGAGCTLPGIDKVVLFEHPIGTCDGTAHFTWDVVNSNLQISDSTANTVGTSDTYIIGPGNNLGVANAPKFAYILGDNNSAFASSTSAAELFIIGSVNTVQDLSTSVTFGPTVTIGQNTIGDGTHANSGGHDNILIGLNAINRGGTFITAIGANSIGQAAGSGSETLGIVLGGYNTQNKINGSGSSGNGSISGFGVLGDLNEINQGGSGTANSIYLVGFDNRADTTLGNITGGGAYIFGLDNEVDGAVGNDVTVFGASNTAHTSGTATCLGSSDNTISGVLNTVTGSASYAVYGGGNVVTSHTCVGVFGLNITATANNTAYYGMSPTAGLVITASNGLGTGSDNVQRSPLIFSKLPACAAGTEGSFASITDSTTATPGATITGSSSHHVLGYCQGTNWVVVVGI